jgi:uncharacterized protein YndB with AHSA1/START domain
MSRQAVAKHLKVLEDANLVRPSAGGAKSGTTPTRSPSTRRMPDSRFVYVIYIRTTPEKPWQALLDPAFTRQFWAGTWQEYAWVAGAPWKLMIPDVRVGDTGEVLEIDPPRRLVLSWRNEFKPELRREGYSRVTCTLGPQGGSVKLTVVHEIARPDSRLIEGVSNGWPHLLSSLKTLLETGESPVETRTWPEGL